MSRPRPPVPRELADTPCRRAAPGLFDPLPSAQSLGSRELRDERAAGITYAARYCNGTDARPPCPHRGECLLWALESRERVVAGGVEVTLAMITKYHRAKREEAERAAQKAQAPEDGSGELAERRGQAGRREPARPQAEGAA